MLLSKNIQRKVFQCLGFYLELVWVFSLVPKDPLGFKQRAKYPEMTSLNFFSIFFSPHLMIFSLILILKVPNSAKHFDRILNISVSS